jgi:hypothetical protein
MIAVELLALCLAAAGALYGIWTKPDVDRKVAISSSAITGLGLLAATTAAIWKSHRAKKSAALAEARRKSEIQAILGGSELSRLEIVWSFERVPTEVLQILSLGAAIVDTRLLQNDERSRAPQAIRERASRAWHLESTVGPLLHAIDTGTFDPSLYQGEPVAEALARWGARDSPAWRDQIGSRIRYVGSVPELLLPLNAQLNAALSLGKREDDRESAGPRYGWDEDDPALFAETNFAFEVEATAEGRDLRLSWRYGPGSLQRAVVREAGAKLAASLPAAFTLLLVSKELECEDYLALGGREFASTRDAPSRNEHRAEWNTHSRLEICVNGLQEPHYTYAVTKLETDTCTTDQGAYDGPTLEFLFTPFDCRLESV